MKNNAIKKLSAAVAVFIMSLNTLTGCSDKGGGTAPSHKVQEGNTSIQLNNSVDYSETEVYCYNTPSENIAEDSDTGIVYADNELILSADDSLKFSDVEKLADEYSGEIVGYIEIVNHYQIKLSQSYSYEELLTLCDEIALKNGVESVYSNIFQSVATDGSKDVYDLLPRFTPNDALWSKHWDNGNDVNWGIKAIHADTAWGYRDLMTPIKIGLIDNCFAVSHDDLTFAARYENDNLNISDSHGTHVAGTMAADFNDGVGISGVYPFGAGNLYGIAFNGTDTNYNNMCGTMQVQYCLSKLLVNNVKVINGSFGFHEPQDAIHRAITTGDDRQFIDIGIQMRDFIRKFLNKNIDFLIVSAAGNDSDKGYGILPSEYASWFNLAKFVDENDTSSLSSVSVSDHIIVVGACKEGWFGKYNRCNFSNEGSALDVMAPGHNIMSTVLGNTHEQKNWQGTSMAAPHVAGTAAMVWSVNPAMSASDVKRIILETATTSVSDSRCNLIDAGMAVTAALGEFGTPDGQYLSDITDNGAVLGTVADAATQDIITGAEVTLYSGDKAIETAVTDAAGNFQIIAQPDTYRIEIKKDDYALYTDDYVPVTLGNVNYMDTIGLRKALKDFSIPLTMHMALGEINCVELTAVPETADRSGISFTSSDESIVSVAEASGIVIAHRLGTAEITAEAEIDGKLIQHTCQITVDNSTRDSVLVLDMSGSMSGTPLTELKEAARSFCKQVIADSPDNRVGIVVFGSRVTTYPMSGDLNQLLNIIDNANDGGGTNMAEAITAGAQLLETEGRDTAIKNMLIMADGLPNRSRSAAPSYISQHFGYNLLAEDAVYDTASMYMDNYNIYSLGFYHGSYSGDIDVQEFLLNSIQNSGYFNVENGDELNFAFGDIADDIGDGSKIIIQIECPVDVTITHDGQTISSADENMLTADFGNIRLFGQDNDIKVVTLEEGTDYDIQLNGTDNGTMDYSIMHYSRDDSLSDIRKFNDVPLNASTRIKTDTAVSENVNLEIDSDGDGSYDTVWSCSNNGEGTESEIIEETTEATKAPEKTPDDNSDKFTGINYGDDDNSGLIVGIIIGIGALTAVIALIAVSVSKNKASDADNQIQGNTEAQVIVPDTPVKRDIRKTITFLSGSMKSAVINIGDGETVTIGKDPAKANIVLGSDYSKVSRVHCRIYYSSSSDAFVVTDCGSLNGTFVSNGMKLKPNKPVYVKSGEKIALGDKNCLIEMG